MTQHSSRSDVREVPTVLFAATYRRDSAHEDALPILRRVDTADLQK